MSDDADRNIIWSYYYILAKIYIYCASNNNENVCVCVNPLKTGKLCVDT